MSGSQVSTRGGSKPLKSTERRWIQALASSYKALRRNEKTMTTKTTQKRTGEQRGPADKSAEQATDAQSPLEAISGSCREVLRYYVQREVIKQATTKAFLSPRAMHGTASGYAEKGQSSGQRPFQSPKQEAKEGRLPHQRQLSPAEKSMNESLTSFGSSSIFPLQFSQKKKAPISETEQGHEGSGEAGFLLEVPEDGSKGELLKTKRKIAAKRPKRSRQAES